MTTLVESTKPFKVRASWVVAQFESYQFLMKDMAEAGFPWEADRRRMAKPLSPICKGQHGQNRQAGDSWNFRRFRSCWLTR